MATTTTERANPSAPRSSSRNSRTSRPRSPTKASTATSHAVCAASMASSSTCRRRSRRTGQAAGLAGRWRSNSAPDAEIEPRPEPRAQRCVRRCRPHATSARTRRQRSLSVQWSAQRVHHPAEPRVGHGQRSADTLVRGGTATVLPGPSRSSAANGMTCAKPWRKPTTSAGISWPSRVSSDRRSPTDTWLLSPSISTTSPDRSNHATFQPVRHDVAQPGAAVGASLQQRSRRSHWKIAPEIENVSTKSSSRQRY